jgi:alginate O-acetyltransferase complex protein AlgI
MIFSSVAYIAFLFVLITIFAIIRPLKPQKWILLIASYYFYTRWDWHFVLLLAGLTLSTFFCVRMMHRHSKKPWLIISILISLSTLAYFKYTNFFLGTLNNVGSLHLQLLDVVLPVGISFIVFEVISYAVDVYRGEARYEESLLDFSLLVAFFPHLISGPILKPNHFLPQLQNPIKITASNLSSGMQLFLWGLMKKILVADRVAPCADTVFQHPSSFSPTTTWLGVLAYAIQIYGDFSGYTDMAIGSAVCLGFQIPQNFNLPYLSRNLGEFWRRWHISLSSWLRDYLYIPLGGNRKGVWRTYVNLAVVMILGGLWHGASWNFILWGSLHGSGLAIHRFLTERKAFPKLPQTVGSFASWLLTFVFVVTAWVPFRSANWDRTLIILRKMYGFYPGERVLWISVSLLFAIPCLLVADTASRAWFDNRRLHLTRFWHQSFFFFCAIGTLVLAPTTSSPFIYFRF